MSFCRFPKPAWVIPKTLESKGQYWLVKPDNPNAVKILTNCGICSTCRISYRQDWKLRMMLEAKYHESSIFLTLTYDDIHLPKNMDLCHSDFQLFMKRLRKRFPHLKLRFVMCGEYGEQTARPHYHAIIFGLVVPDLEEFGQSKNGEVTYTSQIMSDLWGLGFVHVGIGSEDAFGYVASYLAKDTVGDYVSDQFRLIDPTTGLYVDRKKPYLRSSNRKGIGYQFYKDYWQDMFPSDELIIDGVKYAPPQYFTDQLAKDQPELAQDVIRARFEKSQDPRVLAEKTPERLEAKFQNFMAKTGLGRTPDTEDPC